MNKNQIICILKKLEPSDIDEVFKKADKVRKEFLGDEVHLRAIIEISNHCAKDCAYCGLNRTNKKLERYRMGKEEILKAAEKCAQFGFKTIVLQSGEDPALSQEFISETVKEIKERFDVAITLSLGERDFEDYKIWKECGADRYLLKFETTDANLYQTAHPSLIAKKNRRIEILKKLKEIGYEVGSGIMVGLPFQSYDSLVEDLFLIKDLDLDMIAIGPYIPHKETLFSKKLDKIEIREVEKTTLLLIALARILCPTANIPSTTALSVLDPQEGRVMGLKCGANVVMPDLTPEPYKSMYEIYEGKTKSKEWSKEEHEKLLNTLKKAGRKPSLTKGFRLLR
ncbi:MAG: [FeFe] hydrogenase H-cluster radical SAM maturase HydE [Acidobacteria bacterium]|nr:[FeFe] hydrogenase H-cluster radical SAM maturase HydE [Acidobacteriota bacterium]